MNSLSYFGVLHCNCNNVPDTSDPEVIKLFGDEVKHFLENGERFLNLNPEPRAKYKVKHPKKIPVELIDECWKHVQFLQNLPNRINSDEEWVKYELNRLKCFG